MLFPSPSRLPHLQNPHNSSPRSFALGLIQTPAIMPIFFHGIHPQTNRDLLPAPIPNPKMLILLTAHGKGLILLTCSPWPGWLCIQRQKQLLWVVGRGRFVHAPGRLWQEEKAATLLTPRRAQDRVPLPAGSPSEPVGGGAQPNSG